jgi:2-polyprenyl-3-methyl-5-hydroxy-6-metoxy-1,4-benzoquinol methylase
MNMTVFGENERKQRLLVAIASFGTKNLSYLNRIIQRYRSMDFEVEVIVVSEAPKTLDGGEKIVVGLPAKNPWSLPFAHKKIFAENADRYDLFAYSEDDIEITQENIQAFLRVTSALEADEIAGFLRYEVGEGGAISLPDCHDHYHWKADSVKRRGPHTIAEFTNEHAAFYLLTQAQLKRAIASGGFLRAPYEDQYDMLCTAATDPYTVCGFRKVICISALKDFLVHHMSNRYAGQVGISLPAFNEQVQTLMQICDNAHPATTLSKVESNLPHREWSKSYYEQPSGEVLKMIPNDAKTILSIGSGWGAAELQLKQGGALVTALALDSVIGAVAERLGLEVIYGSLNECFNRLKARKFDCVLMTDLVHLQPDLRFVLEQFSKLVEVGGTIVLAGPNFHSAPILLKRLLRKGNYGKLPDFSTSGIRTCGPRELATQIRNAGFSLSNIRWYDHMTNPAFLREVAPHLGNVAARRWALQARRFS